MNRAKAQHASATSSPASYICSLPTGRMQIINSTPFTLSTAVTLPLHMILVLVQIFFFLIFLNLCLVRHGLLEADLSSTAQCVSFTVPRWCNSWKIKNLLRPKFGVSHSMFTHFGSPLNEA